MTNGLSSLAGKILRAPPVAIKKPQISLPCTCHLTAKKWGFTYFWNCALTCIEDWFPLKAHARTVNQRILWTSSQRDTSNDLIHPCITQIFQVLLPVQPFVLSKSFTKQSCQFSFSGNHWFLLENWVDHSEILILLLCQRGFSCISLPGFLLQKPFSLNYFHMKYLVLCGSDDTMDFSASSTKVSTEEWCPSKGLSVRAKAYLLNKNPAFM